MIIVFRQKYNWKWKSLLQLLKQSVTWKHSTTELGIAQHPFFIHGPHHTSVSKILIILANYIVSSVSSNLWLKNKPSYVDVLPERERMLSPLQLTNLINKHMNAPLGLGFLLVTAKHCLTCNNYSIELNLSAACSVQAATATASAGRVFVFASCWC